MKTIDEFEIAIRRDGNAFVAGLPDIGLFARGETSAAALERLEAKKKQLAADIAATGAVNVFPQLPPPTSSERGTLGILGLFVAKTAIVLLLLGAALAGSGVIIANKVHTAIVSAVGSDNMGGGRFWSKVERELQRAADPSQDMPEQQKQQLLANIRVVVNRWRPFVAEIAPLFSVDSQVSSATPDSAHPAK